MLPSEVTAHLETCRLCPRRCAADRTAGEHGPCGAGEAVRLASAVIHVGEEPPISGTRGSATFFFSHCPLSCRFCQNFPISQLGHGKVVDIEAIAERMVRLEARGAHNINLVTATQFAPHLVVAVRIARKQGLRIPIVWNTSGYETPETLDLLRGTVDIYLTDIKYADDAVAKSLSDAADYFQISVTAAERMLAQVGPLTVDANGIGVRGVVVRHLVLPENLAQTPEVLRAVRDRLGPDVPVSLMGQYFPAHRAHTVPALSRPLTEEEYETAQDALLEVGLEEGWVQEMNDPTTRRGA